MQNACNSGSFPVVFLRIHGSFVGPMDITDRLFPPGRAMTRLTYLRTCVSRAHTYAHLPFSFPKNPYRGFLGSLGKEKVNIRTHDAYIRTHHPHIYMHDTTLTPPPVDDTRVQSTRFSFASFLFAGPDQPIFLTKSFCLIGPINTISSQPTVQSHLQPTYKSGLHVRVELKKVKLFFTHFLHIQSDALVGPPSFSSLFKRPG